MNKSLFKPMFLFLAIFTVTALACQTFTPTGGNLVLPTLPSPVITAQAVNPPAVVSQSPAVDLIASQDTLINLYRKVNPGVVSIRVLIPDVGEDLGSGFVIDQEGHIVTNYHVVQNETDLEVGFVSGLKARGKVIGTDLDSDLAVIKVEAPASEIHPIPLGDSDTLEVGQTVIAIGNPFGLEGTMTLGIISGLGRTVDSLHSTPEGGSFSAADVIQTDAAINPGNSGGPLINLNGEVIGANESIRTETFNNTGQPVNSGIGFAISSNTIKRVTPSLITNGKYDYPYLGIISLSEISLLQQEALGLPQSTGVYVTGVTSGGPAERAGLRAGTKDTNTTGLESGGDLIIAIDGQAVKTYNDLISYLVKNKSPGEKVLLTVLRDNQEIKIELTLDKRP